MKHVHIAGVSPRTGTTLMFEMMVSGFRFDDYPMHEQSLLLAPSRELDLYCSKNPGLDDLRFSLAALKRNPDLWIIAMVRDPRDVIVSRHKVNPNVFWSNLGAIKERARFLKRARHHERFIVLRYEELVANPDAVQDMLERRIPFLKRTARFSDFEKVTKAPERATQALGGVRPVSDSSVGRWKGELARVKGQIETFGPMDELLNDLGYAVEPGWTRVLEGVEPDIEPGYWDHFFNRRRLYRRSKSKIWKWIVQAMFLLGRPIKSPNALRKAQMGEK